MTVGTMSAESRDTKERVEADEQPYPRKMLACSVSFAPIAVSQTLEEQTLASIGPDTRVCVWAENSRSLCTRC